MMGYLMRKQMWLVDCFNNSNACLHYVCYICFQGSYGILTWEVFSLGRMAYPGLDPKAIVDLLDKGERLDKPRNSVCSDEM